MPSSCETRGHKGDTLTKGVRLDGKEKPEFIRYVIIHGSVEEVEGMACVSQSEERVLVKRE